jgi:RNA polymerase sigma-70 factor, ECF subfamily
MELSKAKEIAFLELYSTYGPKLSNYCRAMCNNDFLAEDIMSETILVAFENFDNLRDKEKFKFYLFSVASNIFKKYLRRKKIATILTLNKAKYIENEEKSDSKAAISVLYKTLRLLKPIQAEIIVLKEISGFTINEISKFLNMNENTVKTNLVRGKEKMREILENEFSQASKSNLENIKSKSFITNFLAL